MIKYMRVLVNADTPQRDQQIAEKLNIALLELTKGTVGIKYREFTTTQSEWSEPHFIVFTEEPTT